MKENIGEQPLLLIVATAFWTEQCNILKVDLYYNHNQELFHQFRHVSVLHIKIAMMLGRFKLKEVLKAKIHRRIKCNFCNAYSGSLIL